MPSPDVAWLAALWISAEAWAWALRNPVTAAALVAGVVVLLTTAID